MKEIEPERKGSLAGRLLRLFRAGGCFQESISMQEKTAIGSLTGESCHDYQKRNEPALLEAERKKAEALLERQKHPLIY